MKAWLAVLVPLWAWFALCAHWEPIVWDSWGHFFWHRDVGLGAHDVYEFCRDEYLHWNPRLGELATLLSFTPGPWHVLVTPLMELAMLYLLTAVALGRWPRTNADALVFAMLAAMVLVCVPQVGSVLFYRPFAWNFAFALALAAAFAIPYRFAPAAARWWWTPGMLALGVVAGLGAEHTGPALLALAVLVAARERRAWMIAGAIGVLAGWLALFLAPSQHYKYNGLAAHQSILDLLAARGLGGNAKVVSAPLRALWPALAWVAIAIVARVRGVRPQVPRALALIGIAAAVIAVTLLASPKQGPRLALAPVAVACCALAGWIALHLTERWARTAAAVLTAGVLAVAAVQCLSTYRVLGDRFAARLAALLAAPPGSRVTLPRLTIGRTHWTLRDDLEEADRRELLARQAGLAGVDLAP
jgi:hypothetical protein